MSVGSGVPIEVLVIMLAVIPGLVSIFIGVFAFRRITPQVFICLRCGGTFRRAPHRSHAAACPLCAATNWDLPAPDLPARDP